MSLLQKLCKKALARVDDRPAIEYEDRQYGWAQIRQLADTLHATLNHHGIDKGTVVAFVARNRPSALATLLALLAHGHDIRMLYAFQSTESLVRQIEQQQPTVVIATEDIFTPQVTAAVSRLGMVGISLGEMETRSVVAGTCPPPADAVEAQPRVGILTSGTTGVPKQFFISYDLIARYIVGSADEGAELPVWPALPPLLLFFPLANITGIYTTVPALVKGQPVVLLDRFSLPQWRAFVVRHRPTSIGIPPAAFQMLLDADVPPAELSSLKSIGTGAAPLDRNIHRRFEDRYGIPVLLSYGATEFGGPVAAMTTELHHRWGADKLGSVGRALPGFQLRITDPDTGQQLPAGEKGLLEVVSPRIGTHWIRTSDIALIDGDGFVFIVGRADGAIMRGGFKVLPETIENALLQHPDVAAASVVGIPDSRLSEVPAAAIQLKPGSREPAISELDTHLRKLVLATHIPVQWRFVSSLPKTPSFKIDRGAVRQLFLDDAAP